MSNAGKARPTDIAGALALIVGLPLFTYYVWLCVTDFDGSLVLPSVTMLSRIPAPTVISVVLYGAWFLLQSLLQIAAPGRIHEGVTLSDGTRLKYKMNGWFAFWFTLAVAAAAAGLGWIRPTVLYDEFGPLLTTVNIFAFAFSAFIFVLGKRSRSRERRAGNALYDYFLGTSLNPRAGDFDFKLFCEARPGLILWILFDLSFAAKQYAQHGMVTVPMILVNALQFLYIADYYFHEEAILTTWDIKHENFGWMLCWGDLVWVPFLYSLQAHYLVNHTHDLPTAAAIGIVALNLTGYTVFRGANIQKHRFRKNPERPVWGKPAQFIETSRGTLLLTSGWWGIARHANYLGDLIMGLAWCLPAGFEHPLPYFYIVYFTALLVHREWRDNATCLEKYGKDWEAYCRKVRWRIMPGVY